MFAFTWAIMSNQQHLPLNPDGQGAVKTSLVFNTTVSFVTNTNLQHYSGESTYSYLTQLTLMFLQFTSAATGIAAFFALARGLAGRRDMGSFARDLARIVVLFLIPLAALFSIIYIFAGIPMTLEGAASVTTLEGATQTIARGPVAGVSRHQTTRHQRRRFLRPEQHPPARRRGHHLEFPLAARHPDHSDGLRLGLRAHRRPSPPRTCHRLPSWLRSWF